MSESFTKDILSSFIESVSDLMWPGSAIRAVSRVNFENASYGKDRSIEETFIRSRARISWREFLDYVRQINCGTEFDENNICCYMRSLFMQIFDSIEQSYKLKIYVKEKHVGECITHILIEGLSVNGYSVTYEISLNDMDSLVKFIDSKPREQLTVMWTYGITAKKNRIRILAVFNGQIMCDFVEGMQKDFMRVKISDSYLKTMELCKI